MNVSTTSTIETYLENPTSEQPPLGHLSRSTLSMRAKSERKRKTSAHHNSNNRVGFVPVNEDALHKTGIRGRKRYFLYCVLSVMMFVAVLNTLVTAWLIYVLGATHVGLSSFEVSDYGTRTMIRIFQHAGLVTVTMDKAPLGASYDSDLELLARDSALIVQSGSASELGSSLTLDGPNITLTTNDFHIQYGENGSWVSPDFETIVTSDLGIQNLMADDIIATKIREKEGMDDLILESQTRDVNILGLEGVRIKSKQVWFKARGISMVGNVMMKSENVYLPVNTLKPSSMKNKQMGNEVNGADVLKGNVMMEVKGTILDKINTANVKDIMDDVPKVYKLCICSNGKLFLNLSGNDRVSCRIKKNEEKEVCQM